MIRNVSATTCPERTLFYSFATRSLLPLLALLPPFRPPPRCLRPLPRFSFTSFSSFSRPSHLPYLVFLILLFRLNPFAHFLLFFLSSCLNVLVIYWFFVVSICHNLYIYIFFILLYGGKFIFISVSFSFYFLFFSLLFFIPGLFPLPSFIHFLLLFLSIGNLSPSYFVV